jgi:hypothetical protein
MTGAAHAGDKSCNRPQPQEKVVSAPTPDAAIQPAPPPAAGEPAAHRAASAPASSGRTPGQIARDIGLFFVAPYVTLAYLAMFPILGGRLLAQAWRERKAAG